MTKQIYRLTPNNRGDMIEIICSAPDYHMVEIRPEDRTAAQNRFYWATIRQIAEWVKPTGKQYSADVWHEYLKTLFLHTEMIELPNGELKEVERTTTSLTKHDFSDYVTAVLAWANENGVRWSDEMHNAFHDIEMRK